MSTTTLPTSTENTTNTPKQFMNFFSSPAFSGPSPECKPQEFRAFWSACSEAEKAEFRTAKLS
jgi:hypothetical protein